MNIIIVECTFSKKSRAVNQKTLKDKSSNAIKKLGGSIYQGKLIDGRLHNSNMTGTTLKTLVHST